MKKLVFILVALAIVGAVAFAVRTMGARNEASAVDTSDAERIAAAGDSEGADEEDVEAGLRPAAGTYRYSGSGSESVDLLGGSRHSFPRQVHMVVQLDATDDCTWTSNLIYVQEHVERRSYCTTNDGLQDLGFTREIEFFNREQKATFTCADDAMPARFGAEVGESWSWTCSEGTASESTYTATFVGDEPLTIAGERVTTAHVLVATELTGSTNGHNDSEFWFLESGLAAKFTTDLDVQTRSVLGEAHLLERTSYSLDSLEPADADR